jgi:hypothetical protein
MKFVTVVSLWLAWLAASARGEGVLIANPLEAFVYGKYDLGDEYFISGNQNTFIFRCVLTEAKRYRWNSAIRDLNLGKSWRALGDLQEKEKRQFCLRRYKKSHQHRLP